MKGWELLFNNLLGQNENVFISCWTKNGASWFVMLPNKCNIDEEKIFLDNFELKYDDIVEIEIPELFNPNGANFTNDLSSCYRSIKNIEGISVDKLVKEQGPYTGDYLRIKSSI